MKVQYRVEGKLVVVVVVARVIPVSALAVMGFGNGHVETWVLVMVLGMVMVTRPQGRG
jgi:hypothetical protein